MVVAAQLAVMACEKVPLCGAEVAAVEAGAGVPRYPGGGATVCGGGVGEERPGVCELL